jgi:hypothetical protein
MTCRVHIEPDVTRGWWISFTTSHPSEFAQVVGAIKGLPPAARRFNPERRAWWIADEPSLRQLADILPGINSYFRKSTSSKTPCGVAPRAVMDAFTALHLLPTAPPELVTAARRTLARTLHPDVGGDLRAMVTVNSSADIAAEWAERHQVKRRTA